MELDHARRLLLLSDTHMCRRPILWRALKSNKAGFDMMAMLE